MLERVNQLGAPLPPWGRNTWFMYSLYSLYSALVKELTCRFNAVVMLWYYCCLAHSRYNTAYHCDAVMLPCCDAITRWYMLPMLIL